MRTLIQKESRKKHIFVVVVCTLEHVSFFIWFYLLSVCSMNTIRLPSCWVCMRENVKNTEESLFIWGQKKKVNTGLKHIFFVVFCLLFVCFCTLFSVQTHRFFFFCSWFLFNCCFCCHCPFLLLLQYFVFAPLYLYIASMYECRKRQYQNQTLFFKPSTNEANRKLKRWVEWKIYFRTYRS